MAKYYKKVVIEKAWTQPVLTSNGTLGGDSFAVSGYGTIGSEHTTRGTSYAYGGFDGVEADATWLDFNDYYPLTMYNPTPICITGFDFVWDTTWGSGTYNGNISASNDNSNWATLYTGAIASGSANTVTFTNTAKYTYYKISLTSTNASRGVGFKSCHITATTQTILWQECTKAEYDQLPDDQRKIVTDVYSIFSIGKYYKKIFEILPWEQPVLTSEGTIGGTEYGVTADVRVGESKNAFDNNVSTYWLTNLGNNTNYITFYSPVSIKPSQVRLRGQSGYAPPRSFEIQVSNDNSTWTTLYSGSLSNHMPYDITCNTNATDFYNYIRIYITSKYTLAGGNRYALIGEVAITATQKTEKWQECTKEEYDQLPDDKKIVANTYNALVRNSQQSLYKTLNSSEYTSEAQAQEGVNDIKFSPSNLYGMTSLSSYIRISQNQKVVFELPDNLVRVNYVHHKGYSIGNAMPPSNINQVDISNDGTNWTTVATYSMPTYGIAGDVENQLDLPKIKYIRFNFWFHGSGSPSYYGSGGVGSVYINCLIREKGKEKSVNLYYLGGNKS